MPDILSPDDIRLQRIQALRQIGMPNPPTIGAPGAAPDVQDGASQLQPVSTPQLQKMTGDSPVKPLNFHQREQLPITSPDAPAGSISAHQSQLSKLADERANPWSTPENHPGTLGKVGHILSTVGNIAGDIVAPATMQNIPGTDLNKRLQERSLQGQVAGQQKEQAAEGVAKENADSEQKLRGAEAGQFDTVPFKLSDGTEIPVQQKDVASLQKEIESGKSKQSVADTTNATKKDIATQSTDSRETIAAAGNESKETLAGNKITSTEKVAGANIASREHVAQLRTEASKMIAAEKQANTDDPNKLTNAMKTMKQTAQATLPELDNALAETEKVKGLLGPTSGRWNDFWQGKVGASDPQFAHYKDEISFISTAVTLAHARGRMSNELFEHFQKMFDAGKQDANNMKEALTVAKEWLGGYAQMGEHPTAQGGKTGDPLGIR